MVKIFQDNPKITSQINRAALLSHNLLLLKKQLEDETFPPEKSKSEGICMEAYRGMFHSCRIPHQERDYTVYYPYSETNHIVVLKANQFYYFKSCYSDGKPLSAAHIRKQLQSILEIHKDSTQYWPVGILASQNRTNWANAKDRLVKSEVNSNSLEIIQKCAFIIALDDFSPSNFNEFSGRVWAGFDDIANRFMDIPINLICFNDGKAGIIGEHSKMDGLPVCRLLDFVVEMEKEQCSKVDMWSSPNNEQLEIPKKLKWEISEIIKKDITVATQEVKQILSNVNYNVLCLDLGKKVWKALSVSPDAAMQLAFQITYKKIHKKTPAVYE